MLYNANGQPLSSVPASAIIYTPSVPANWVPTPANVAAALDQLSANNLTRQNSGALGPLATVSFTTTAIAPVMSARYLVIAKLTVTTTGVANVTATLLQGATTLDTSQGGTGGAGPLNLTCIGTFVGTAAPQTFTIQATASAGTLTAAISGLTITVLEDT
jgi:hypothetical protein